MMRLATNNQDVIRRANAQIHTAQRSLSYFEETLRQLMARKQQTADSSASSQLSLGSSLFPEQPFNFRLSNRVPDDRARSTQIPPNAEWDGTNNQYINPPKDDMPKAKTYSALGSLLHALRCPIPAFPNNAFIFVQIWSKLIPLSRPPRYLGCFISSSSNSK